MTALTHLALLIACASILIAISQYFRHVRDMRQLELDAEYRERHGRAEEEADARAEEAERQFVRDMAAQGFQQEAVLESEDEYEGTMGPVHERRWQLAWRKVNQAEPSVG